MATEPWTEWDDSIEKLLDVIKDRTGIKFDAPSDEARRELYEGLAEELDDIFDERKGF